MSQSINNYNQTLHQTIDSQNNGHSHPELLIESMFNPIVRVIPADDWSKIRAIWIPLLHHDYRNQLQRSEKIKILEQKTDKFGTIQGYLTAPNENYIPYLTTFFNPTWSTTLIEEYILQAFHNQVELIQSVIDEDGIIIKKIIIGKTKINMLITIHLNQQGNIIDAAPLFSKE